MKMRLFAVLGSVGLLTSLMGAVACGPVTPGTGGSGGAGGAGGKGEGGASVGSTGSGGTGGAGGAAACKTCSEYTPEDIKVFGGMDQAAKDAAIKSFCTAATDPNKLDAQMLVQAYYACACGMGGKCATQCAASACTGVAPDATCVKCVQDAQTGCGTEFGACTGDAP
jgi:hypothetical protein